MKNYIKNLFKKSIVKVDLVTGSLNRNDRIGALHRAWGHVFTSHMKGDYYEFGVYKGSSFCESIRQYKAFRFWLQSQLNSAEKWRVDVALQYAQYSPTFFGLDTFSGMPDNDEKNYIFSAGTFMSDYDLVKKQVDIVAKSGGG